MNRTNKRSGGEFFVNKLPLEIATAINDCMGIEVVLNTMPAIQCLMNGGHSPSIEILIILHTATTVIERKVVFIHPTPKPTEPCYQAQKAAFEMVEELQFILASIADEIAGAIKNQTYVPVDKANQLDLDRK